MSDSTELLRHSYLSSVFVSIRNEEEAGGHWRQDEGRQSVLLINQIHSNCAYGFIYNSTMKHGGITETVY